MTQITKPEDLAYQATVLTEKAASHTLKRRALTTLGVFGTAIGISVFAPQALTAALALITTYSLWDLKNGRDKAKTLRDSFNFVAQNLSGHDTIYQMEPLQKACDQVKDFSLNDLNIVEHFKRDRFGTGMAGFFCLFIPALAPCFIANLLAAGDSRRINDIQSAAQQSQINLQKKYPDRLTPVV